MTIEFIMAEFYSKNRVNVDNILAYFPEASIRVYKDDNTPFLFDSRHPRAGWRMNDYQKFAGILESKADIAIAIDADMEMVSSKVRTIIPLIQKFGFCVPASSRRLVSHDTMIGADSDKQLDETLGTGHTMCTAFIAADPKDICVRKCLFEAREMMKENPLRGPLVLWRAIWKTGIYPYILPQQWCVCEDDIGIGNEIILHVGHEKVWKHYNRPSPLIAAK